MRDVALLSGLVLCVPVLSPCSAQAWPPPRGELTVSTTFQRVVAHGHFMDDGSKVPGYRTRATNLALNLSYGITDRLAVSVDLPFVNVKYVGPEEPFNLPDNTLDDGTYHGTLSDIGIAVSGQVLDYPIAVTPFLAVSIPSHEYPTLGEAAGGRGFQEYQLGVHGGRVLDPFLPNAFLHGTYSYTFVRQNIDIPLNYSNLELSAGYVIAQMAQVSVFWRRRFAHGGLTFDSLFAAPPEIFRNMDRVVRISYQHVGVAASMPVSESMSAHANFVKFVSGVDAHYGYGFSAGFSWTWHTFHEPSPFDLD